MLRWKPAKGFSAKPHSPGYNTPGPCTVNSPEPWIYENKYKCSGAVMADMPLVTAVNQITTGAVLPLKWLPVLR